MPFTCPRCGRTSHHPLDEAEGYCGACHDFTGARTLVGLWTVGDAVIPLIVDPTLPPDVIRVEPLPPARREPPC